MAETIKFHFIIDMSAAEETIQSKEVFRPKTAPLINRVLDFMSAVRTGVVLLCILVVLAMVGMLIMQQNVEGFDTYYASLTPAQRTVYGYLGLFDIYKSWRTWFKSYGSGLCIYS